MSNLSFSGRRRVVDELSGSCDGKSDFSPSCAFEHRNGLFLQSAHFSVLFNVTSLIVVLTARHGFLLQMFNCITELVLRAKKEVLAKQQQQQQNDVVKLSRNSKRKKKCC